MQKRNTLSLVLGFVCLFWLNGSHGVYGFNPYYGYLPSGAPAAASWAYQQPAESARKSTAGAYPGYDSLAYAGAYGYPTPVLPYPGAAAAADNKQKKTYENPQKKQSAGAGQYSTYPGYGSLAYSGAYGYLPPAIGYPGAAYNQQQKSSPAAGLYGGYGPVSGHSYPPPYGQSAAEVGGPYTMSAQAISVGGAVASSTVANVNNRKDGGSKAAGGVVANVAGGKVVAQIGTAVPAPPTTTAKPARAACTREKSQPTEKPCRWGIYKCKICARKAKRMNG